jgi:5-methyltetrahydrofolate--homocysteine methyltransferase
MMKTTVSGATKEVVIGHDQPMVIIGERINPSGKKRLAEALRTGDLEIVQKEAVAQVQAGADIIDVNVGTPGVDEVALLPEVVKAVMEAVDVPLCLDSAKPEALAAALKVYKGKALINSVTGEGQSLADVLPLVKEYGAAVIGLVQDDAGIPKAPEQRVAIARRIVEQAEAVGIPREDIVIDCLALALDSSSGLVAIETIRQVRAELGVNITMGASNASFGLPDRDVVNSAFMAMAIAAGATCLIADAAKVRPIILAADLVMGRDRMARSYLRAYRQRQGS